MSKHDYIRITFGAFHRFSTNFDKAISAISWFWTEEATTIDGVDF